jgi:hypothetical protein
MRRPNSGRFQKKPSAVASNNYRMDATSVCVCARALFWGWLVKLCLCPTITVQCHHSGNFLTDHCIWMKDHILW